MKRTVAQIGALLALVVASAVAAAPANACVSITGCSTDVGGGHVNVRSSFEGPAVASVVGARDD